MRTNPNAQTPPPTSAPVGVQQPQTPGRITGVLGSIGTAILPGLGTILGAIAGGLIGNWQSKKQAKRELAANLELMKYQNEYNSPAMQKKRLIEAGLSPNLVYGSNAVTGNLTDVPSYQENAVEIPVQEPIMEAIDMYQNMKMQKIQAENIEANTNAVNIKAVNEALMGENLKIDAMLKAQDLKQRTRNEDYQATINKYLADLAEVNVANALKTGRLTEEEINNKTMLRGLIEAQIYKETQSGKETAEYVKMLQNGINPHDSAWIRVAVKIMEKFGINTDDIVEAFKKEKPVNKYPELPWNVTRQQQNNAKGAMPWNVNTVNKNK